MKNTKLRALKRIAKNTTLTVSVLLAMVVFVLSSFQFALTNINGAFLQFTSGAYILAFWWVNDGGCDNEN